VCKCCSVELITVFGFRTVVYETEHLQPTTIKTVSHSQSQCFPDCQLAEGVKDVMHLSFICSTCTKESLWCL